MDIDPKDVLEDKERRDELELEQDREKLKLNGLVAITIALIATFMGMCKIKDENIVLEMQKAQASKIDTWNFYQARNIRQDVYQTTADELKAQASVPGPGQIEFKTQSGVYVKLAAEQKKKKEDVKKEAEGYDKDYEKLHSRHDEFDLEDAALAIAVSLFAITSLTQKKWLYAVALVPAIGGIFMGIAGLTNMGIRIDALMKLLG